MDRYIHLHIYIYYTNMIIYLFIYIYIYMIDILDGIIVVKPSPVWDSYDVAMPWYHDKLISISWDMGISYGSDKG